MNQAEIFKLIVNMVLTLAALYYGPQLVVKGIMTGYYEVKRRYPTINNHNYNVTLGLPMLHVLKAFFHREGALGAEQRAEVELGARRAMIAQFASHLLQDEKIARRSVDGNHVYSFTQGDFARVANDFDTKYAPAQAKEQ